MPSLGADMDAGRLLEWYVKPGDSVKRGDIVALVDTDKAAIEVEIFDDGVIGDLLVPPGETVPVGTPLATVLPAGTVVEAAAQAGPAETAAVEPASVETASVEAAPVEAAPVEPAGTPAKAAPPPAAAPPHAVEAAPEPIPESPAARPQATPAARNHARVLGIDLAEVTGSGKHGVITCQDVDAAAKVAEAAVAEAASREVERPAAPTGAAPTPAPPRPAPAARAPAPAAGPAVAEPPAVHVRASPLARRLAAEFDVELAAVTGTGPAGAVTEDDVRAAAGAVPSAPGTSRTPAEVAALSGAGPTGPTIPEAPEPRPSEPGDQRYAAMRRAIAAAMSKSKREIPHYYLSLNVDMTRALAWLEAANLERPITGRLLPAVLVLKATALAARDVPDVNGFYLEDGFHPSEAVHLGVGISLRQGGLIAPAIHDADQKDLDALMTDLRDLVKRTRNLQLRSSELSDATMTTTNLGDQGVESVFGIIYPPQVALVGYGRILERPWAENGMLAVRKQMHLTLAADHRASDGHRGGLFLTAISDHLQHPEEL